ncbi:MAG: polyprenyl synthetase family protein [Candidatus Cryptobacteroides sp.]
MITESQIEILLNELFENIKFNDKPERLYEPLKYMIAIGGKKLRPRLCLTTYSLYKDNYDDSIMQPAAALEVFHSFTLIHDDIMDKSPLRRGMDAVWKKWGEDSAILSGDVMCIDSYRRMCYAPSDILPKVLALFNKTAAQVCEGQQLDMDFEHLDEIPMKDYINMIGLKTGVLIACAAKMGAMIAGAPEDECENLYWYGYYLGLAFQIADDYLDAYGDAKVFGKPIGGDIINQKKSWLTTRALEKSGAMTSEGASNIMSSKGIDCSLSAIIETMRSEADTEDKKLKKITKVKAIYNALGINEDAKYEILRLNEKAIGFAAKACKGVRLESLKRFSEKLIGRTK